MSQKATLRLRFVLNQATGKKDNKQAMQRAGSEFAAVIVRQVGLVAAEERYKELTQSIKAELYRDVQQEVERIAYYYNRYVVGRAGIRDRAITLKGQTTTVREDMKFGKWEPLAKSTVRRKKHSRFFEDKKNLREQTQAGHVWEDAFGPIQIRVVRTKSGLVDLGGARPYRGLGARGRNNFSVARIEVFALGKITAAMLPDLATGVPAQSGYTDQARRAGMLDMLPGGKNGLRYKLANWGRQSGVDAPYRPSLEPFLSFVLTRAIPRAVQSRIVDPKVMYGKGARFVRPRPTP